jgi:hypothetical protein
MQSVWRSLNGPSQGRHVGKSFPCLNELNSCDYQAGLLGFQGLDFLPVPKGFRASES